jgi:hypothetical protein
VNAYLSGGSVQEIFTQPIYNLGNNTLAAMGNMEFFGFGMFVNLGIIIIPFLHINPNILINFFMSYMLIKRNPT